MGGLNAIVSVMDSCVNSATVQIAAFHALRNIVCRNCESILIKLGPVYFTKHFLPVISPSELSTIALDMELTIFLIKFFKFLFIDIHYLAEIIN